MSCKVSDKEKCNLAFNVKSSMGGDHISANLVKLIYYEMHFIKNWVNEWASVLAQFQKHCVWSMYLHYRYKVYAIIELLKINTYHFLSTARKFSRLLKLSSVFLPKKDWLRKTLLFVIECLKIREKQEANIFQQHG